MKIHKDLEVWKLSIDFVTEIYKITESFPKTEIYGLTSQIRRAAISIPSNIAEGAARNYNKEFNYFLYIALASGSEVETQLIISKNLDYINTAQFKELSNRLNTIQKMIQGLIRSLNK